MPCTYYTSAEERQMAAERYRAELDRLTHENDLLREALFVALDGGEIDPEFLKQIQHDQFKHRKEDLARLEETFRKSLKETNDYARETIIYGLLGRVVAADPTKPLEPQLGFDPDAY